MFIPQTYKSEEGAQVCMMCQEKFSIPTTDTNEYVLCCDQPECVNKYTAQQTQIAAVNAGQ